MIGRYVRSLVGSDHTISITTSCKPRRGDIIVRGQSLDSPLLCVKQSDASRRVHWVCWVIGKIVGFEGQSLISRSWIKFRMTALNQSWNKFRTWFRMTCCLYVIPVISFCHFERSEKSLPPTLRFLSHYVPSKWQSNTSFRAWPGIFILTTVDPESSSGWHLLFTIKLRRGDIIVRGQSLKIKRFYLNYLIKIFTILNTYNYN